MDGRCGGCKHWLNPWGNEPYTNYGEHVPTPEDRPRWGTCQQVTMATDSTELGDLPAFVIDGSQYSADLHVRDDFGCTLFEPKETE